MRVCVAHVIFRKNPVPFPVLSYLFLQELGLLIKLDPFNAMQRLSKVILKSHRACHAFLARLRDSFFKEYRSDLEEVEAVLRQEGKSDAEIETMKKHNWGDFLSLSRR